MRTTITIADDVLAEMERMRANDGLGPSAALNLLARRGIAASGTRPEAYAHRSVSLGLRGDLHNVGEVLELLDGAG